MLTVNLVAGEMIAASLEDGRLLGRWTFQDGWPMATYESGLDRDGTAVASLQHQGQAANPRGRRAAGGGRCWTAVWMGSNAGNPYCLLPPLIKDGTPFTVLMESDMACRVRPFACSC